MIKFKQFLAMLLVVFSAMVHAQTNYCVSGCNENTFINASDPNTLEYDNVVAGYHGTIIKEVNGVIKLWGQYLGADGSNVLSPIELTPANGYSYTGNVLKYTMGGYQQAALLTTNGLYIWGGGSTHLLVNTAIKSGTSFQFMGNTIGTVGTAIKSATGLPVGVNPADVKMMFGSTLTLGVVTCTGDAWVLSGAANKTGDIAGNDNVWHRVKTDDPGNPYLTGVVAMRGSSQAMYALTSTGELYTWGSRTYLGDNTAFANRQYATKMTKPTGMTGTPKMIGMTVRTDVDNSYYLLSSTGELWSLGKNGRRQLGDFTGTDALSWVRTKKSSAANDFLPAIAWIAPQEHDDRYASVNVLTTAGKIYAWGDSSSYSIGLANNINDPTANPGGIDPNDKFLAVFTGGHVSMAIKQCSEKYGYVGHRVNGSMGDGTNTDAIEQTYNFTNTASINLCGASVTPPKVKDLKICPSTTGNLDNANLETPKSNIEWHIANDRTSALVPNPNAVGPGTYYAFFTTASGLCQNLSSVVTVSNFGPGEGCALATPDINQTPVNTPVKGNVLTNDSGTGTLTVTGASQGGNPITIGTPTQVSGVDSNGNPVANAGTITLNSDGTYTFTPAPGFTGTINPINYTTTDANGATSTTHLDIKVIPDTVPGTNTKPIAQDDTATTPINTPVSSNALSNDSDPDGNPLTITGASQGGTNIPIGTATQVSGVDSNGNPVANAGTLTLNSNGTYTFTPATGFTGTVNPIKYTISDGQGGTDTAQIDITVTPVPATTNQTYANDDANTAPKGQTMNGNVLSNDTDPQGNTQTVTGATITSAAGTAMNTAVTIGSATVIPGVGTLTLNANGTYTFVPDPNFVGTVVVPYTICDNGVPQACDTATLYLTSLNLGVCFNDPILTGNGPATKVGITLLRRAGSKNTDNWPMVRKSGHIALESNTKGFVPTRVAKADLGNILNPQEGMMVYDTTDKCLKIYTSGAWKCFNTPSCP